MTAEEARKLNIGDRVYWRGQAHDGGRVTVRSWNGVVVAWDNGQTANIHYNDMREIQLEATKHLKVDDRGY
jgi:hypothetical protein